MSVRFFIPRIAVFLAVSGACALVYQVAWLRLLRLVFGASTASSAAVLAIFMGGLGFGGLLIGRWGERTENPLALYGWLEIGIGVAAGLSPWLVEAIRALYVAIGGTTTLGLVGGTLFRMLLAALVLGVPAFLMGGTLPVAMRAATSTADLGRRAVGLLYAVNTLGAVLGTVATTFAFIELFGIRTTIWCAALLNLLVGIAARALSRRQGAVEPVETTPETGFPQRALAPVPLVLAAAALVGFVFFSMELVWYRMLAPLLGGTTYTFGIILAVALAGIGLGGIAYGLERRRRRPSLTTFAATCGLEALCVVLPLACGPQIALLALTLRDLGALGFGGLATGWVIVAGLVVLPASAVAGYQFPLLVALLGEGREGVSRQVGLAYAWNTVGAIAGSLAGGFGLLPLLSAPGLWRTSVVLLVALSLACLGAAFVSTRRRAATAVVGGVGLAALALTLAPGPGAFWRHGGIGAGRSASSFDDRNEFRAARLNAELAILWETDGRESAIGLNGLNGLSFIVNGKSDGNSLSDAGTQVMAPLVGAALHPAPRRALVVGLGTGSSAGWLAAMETVEAVDVIELEPAVLRVAEACHAVNRDVLAHPEVDVLLGDGREYLLTTERTYDLVFSEPSNPYRAGVASLFTLEFYQAAAERLAPDGIFLQWLQGYEVDADVVRSVYATLGEVFPHVETWRTLSADLLLVASREPVTHDVERLRQRLASPALAAALPAVWGVDGLEGLYTGYVAGPEFARRMTTQRGDWINTDDHPIIEFGFARDVGRSGLLSMNDLARWASEWRAARPATVGGEVDWEAVDELRAVRAVRFDDAVPPPASNAAESRARWRARVAYERGDLRAAVRHWREQEREPQSRIDVALLAEGLAQRGAEEALPYIDELERLQPVEAAATRARWLVRNDDPAAAGAHLVRAFEAYRTDPWPQRELMSRALELAAELGADDEELATNLVSSLRTPFASNAIDLDRALTVLRLSEIAADVDCATALEYFEPHPIWTEDFLRSRWRCYERLEHPRAAAARADLETFLAHAPPPLALPDEADD